MLDHGNLRAIGSGLRRILAVLAVFAVASLGLASSPGARTDAAAAPRPDGPPAVTGGTIDVYVHVISGAADEGGVADSTIEAQMDVLNDAFAPSGWSFNLLGVTRTTNDAWYRVAQGSTAERDMKLALHRGTADDLNIYTAQVSSLGWSTPPWDHQRRPHEDGVVLSESSLPGGTSAPFNLGDTGVHEVGHWMGLHDTYEGGCSKRGDLVSDTPAQRTPSIGCPVVQDTCRAVGVDPSRNFMDDSDDACRQEFTAGQDARMDLQYSQYRWQK